MTPRIKICGITNEKEALWLNEESVEYAGFVLYEKSRRYIPIAEAKEIFEKLNRDIIKVAVTVSPDIEQMKEIEAAGFDLLQLHGIWKEEVLKQAKIPLWLAVNFSGIEDPLQEKWPFGDVNYAENPNIQAVLLDAKEYGSGRTFGWEHSREGGREASYRTFIRQLKEAGIRFVLAGGLCSSNAAQGIRMFCPDVVDVSTGVESEGKKDREKIAAFIRSVRKAQQCPAGE